MQVNHLNESVAQKIADGIMNIVPYNINIMDNDGIIIASGDKKRINKVHKGAVKALSLKKPYVVYEDTETEREGINLPIFYNQNIVGVIGVSGSTDEVMQIGQIVVMTAQLMIENQIFSEMTAIKESRLKDFLYDWITLDKSHYNGEFLDSANYLGIDLSLSRTAVIITSNRIRYSIIEGIKRILEPNEYIVRQRMEEVLILFHSNDQLEKRLNKILSLSKDFLNCYVGEASDIASVSTECAMQAYSIAQVLGLTKRIIHFREVSLECSLSTVKMTKEIEQIGEKLYKKDPSGIFQETILAYVKYTDNYAKLCEYLHVHRNTLNYRLTKIEETLGLNPRSSRDLMVLYIAIIKMQKE